MKTIITLLFVTLMAGCSGGGYHYREYDSRGNLTVKEDLDFLNFMVIADRKGITAKTDRLDIIVGASNTKPDPNAIEAAFEGAVRGLK